MEAGLPTQVALAHNPPHLEFPEVIQAHVAMCRVRRVARVTSKHVVHLVGGVEHKLVGVAWSREAGLGLLPRPLSSLEHAAPLVCVDGVEPERVGGLLLLLPWPLSVVKLVEALAREGRKRGRERGREGGEGGGREEERERGEEREREKEGGREREREGEKRRGERGL